LYGGRARAAVEGKVLVFLAGVEPPEEGGTREDYPSKWKNALLCSASASVPPGTGERSKPRRPASSSAGAEGVSRTRLFFSPLEQWVVNKGPPARLAQWKRGVGVWENARRGRGRKQIKEEGAQRSLS